MHIKYINIILSLDMKKIIYYNILLLYAKINRFLRFYSVNILHTQYSYYIILTHTILNLQKILFIKLYSK